MPKIVDHEEHRKTLAAEAAKLFSRQGYSALGMREIARELGLSKSALYHYFPTKKALFAASSAHVTQGVAEQAVALSAVTGGSVEERKTVMRDLFEALAPQTASEISLLMDYLRGRPAEDIAADPSMRIANERYHELFAVFAGEEYAQAAYCLFLGGLLQHYFDGGKTSFADIEPVLDLILNE